MSRVLGVVGELSLHSVAFVSENFGASLCEVAFSFWNSILHLPFHSAQLIVISEPPKAVRSLIRSRNQPQVHCKKNHDILSRCNSQRQSHVGLACTRAHAVLPTPMPYAHNSGGFFKKATVRRSGSIPPGPLPSLDFHLDDKWLTPCQNVRFILQQRVS